MMLSRIRSGLESAYKWITSEIESEFLLPPGMHAMVANLKTGLLSELQRIEKPCRPGELRVD
jgi:hypothetical protein